MFNETDRFGAKGKAVRHRETSQINKVTAKLSAFDEWMRSGFRGLRLAGE